MPLGKRVAVVTGSNKGIGYAVVKKLSQEFDGDVILCSRDMGRGEAAVNSLKSASVKLHQLTVNDTDSVSALRHFIEEEYGGLDLLINNAGYANIFQMETVSPEVAELTMDSNFYGLLTVSESFLPLMRDNGCIVNVSSSAGVLNWMRSKEHRDLLQSDSLTRQDLEAIARQYLRDVRDLESDSLSGKGWPVYGVYWLTKILITAYTFLCHRQLASDQRNVRVNAINPGFTQTDMTFNNGPLTADEAAVNVLKAASCEESGVFVWSDGKMVPWLLDEERFKELEIAMRTGAQALADAAIRRPSQSQ